MLKPAEIIFFVLCLSIAAIVALLVLPGSELRLQEIAVIKLFYLAILNLFAAGFIIVFGGIRERILNGICASPQASAIFLGLYLVANALVIAK